MQTLEKKEQNKDKKSKAIEMPDDPPNVESVLNVIHGGSKISSLTQSTIKRYARELNGVNSTFIRGHQCP